MKTSKKLLSVFLSVLMIALTLSCLSAAFTVSALDATGQCGDNVTWSFDSSSGELTLSGSGDMWDYSSSASPFKNKSEIKSVVISSGVTNIGKYAFAYCENLASLTIPSTVNTIKYGAFHSCTGLNGVTIPSSVKELENYAFFDCGLTSLTLPNGLEEIGYCAFGGCKLTDVTIPASVTQLDNGAFSSCPITAYTVAAESQTYASDENGCLYNKAKTVLLRYPSGNNRTDFIVPSGVTTIEENAFYYCLFLTSVMVPAGVTDVHSEAFCGAYSLESIAVDAENPNYASDASGCLYNKAKTTLLAYPIGSSRTSFRIPAGVTTIGEWAFYSAKITSLIIPISVTSIRSYAFWFCNSLNDVYYAGSAAQWHNDVSVGGSNGKLTGANFHYNYVGPSYTVTLIADEGGTVSGGGTYYEGDIVTVTATPNPGYCFDFWYESGARLSSEQSYSFEAYDAELRATFTWVGHIDPGTTTYTVTANAQTGGSVTGGGTFDSGATTTLTATPNEGYRFVGWFDGETQVSDQAEYAFSVTGDITLLAKFEEDTSSDPGTAVTYTVTANAQTGGSAAGGGTFDSGATATLMATPNEGYRFVGWFEGETLVNDSASYSFTVTKDVTLTAKFEKEADPTDPGTGTDDPTPSEPENVCPWCGGQHEGFFQRIIGFFHNIFAKIFGAKY